MKSPLIATISYLWRGSPRWRWAVIVSAALTLLAVIGGNINLTPTQPPFNPPQPPSVPPVGTSPPQVYPTPQKPINTVAPVDQQAAYRLDDFFTAATSAKNKPEEGERCEDIASAAKKLYEGDKGQAAPAQKNMIAEADKCKMRLADSDEHWRQVESADKNLAQGRSFSAVQTFITKVDALDAFDRSRSEAAERKRDWLGQAPALKSELEQFKKDLAALEAAALLYRPNDSQALGTAEEMKGIYKRLQHPSIRPNPEELTASQKQAIDLGQKIVKDLAASDQRLSALDLAWQRHDTDPMAVITMLARMSAVDKARWDKGGHPVDIKAMEVASGQALPAVVGRLLSSYSGGKSRDVAEQIIGVAGMAKQTGVALPAETAQGVERVSEDIKQSGERLDRLVKAARAWDGRTKGARNQAMEKEILAALDAVVAEPGNIKIEAQVNAFDAAAMTPEQSGAFGKLKVAAAQFGKGSGPVSGLTVFLDIASLRDKNVAPMGNYLQERLQADGFVVTPQTGDAAMTLTVFDPAISGQGNDEATGQERYSVSVRAKLTLSYSGRVIDLGQMALIGRAPDVRSAITVAEKALAEKIVKAMRKALESGIGESR